MRSLGICIRRAFPGGPGLNRPRYGPGMEDPEGLAFGEVAELYDRVRPAYPEAVYATISGAVGTARRALEPGAGTGHATAEIAGRGIAVDAVAPDGRMAHLAELRCAQACRSGSSDHASRTGKDRPARSTWSSAPRRGTGSTTV